MELLPTDADKDRYQQFLLNQFVDATKSLKWCPGPGCELAVNAPSLGAQDCFCECGHAFCFKCEKEAHVPLDCYYRNMFVDKMKENDGVSDNTELWIRVSTKPCPKCHTNIEKNSGCMHMT